MGALIVPGQPLVAGQGAGQLNQYYGFADANPTTFTSATQGNLCTAYTIPAGEPYANSAYEMHCAGAGVQGSTAQTLLFQMFLGTAFGGTPTIGGVTFSASQAFSFSLTMSLVCADGISAWWGDLQGSVVEGTATLIPGTAGQQPVAIAAVNSTVHTAAVSGALTAVIQAKWGSATGAPTMTNVKTTFRKVA